MKEKQGVLVKSNRIYIPIIIFSIVLGIAVSVILRTSYVDDICFEVTEKMSEYEYVNIEDLNNEYLRDNAVSIESLKSHSDVIAKIKVKTNPNRNKHSMYTITEAEVIDVIKGNVNQDEISLLEPVMYKDDKVYGVNRYYWLDCNREYLVFLRKHKDVHIGSGKYIYSFVSTKYGMYDLDEKNIDKKDKKYYEIWKDVVRNNNIN